MVENHAPHPYPPAVRFLLAALALLLILGIFANMASLSRPSQYVNALQTVANGPDHAADIHRLPVLDFNRVLYLHGPITSASGESATPLFRLAEQPALSPATFTDDTGSLEILAHNLPLTADPPQEYRFGEPLYFLGWRTLSSAITLFAVAKSQDELVRLLETRTSGWKSALFYQGLLLAGITFTVFWLLNISLLSNISLRWVQLLIVNLVFLILFYSVLLLSSYPLWGTLPQTLLILLLANLIFVPLSLLLRPRS